MSFDNSEFESRVLRIPKDAFARSPIWMLSRMTCLSLRLRARGFPNNCTAAYGSIPAHCYSLLDASLFDTPTSKAIKAE
jgi:hypothetical protein